MSADIIPIWTPQDSIDTAEAFAAEIANAERGVIVEAGPYRAPRLALPPQRQRQEWFDFLLTRSRERKARAMDFLAVSLLMAFMAALGACAYFAAVPR